MAAYITGASGTVILEGLLDGGKNTGVVTDENYKRTMKITDNPIEEGSDINDHAQIQPPDLSIKAVVIDGKYKEILTAMYDNREFVSYNYIESEDNLLIKSLVMKHDAKNATGFSADITFKKIKMVSSQKVKVAIPASSTGKTPVPHQMVALNKKAARLLRAKKLTVYWPPNLQAITARSARQLQGGKYGIICYLGLHSYRRG